MSEPKKRKVKSAEKGARSNVYKCLARDNTWKVSCSLRAYFKEEKKKEEASK